MLNIGEILKATGGRLLSGNRRCRIPGISIDSRTIKKGELFLAIKGRRFDGHYFIRDVFKKGACGAVVGNNLQEPSLVKEGRIIKVKDSLKALGDIAAYHRKRFDIPVIGITGSNGKTTVKEMVWHILSAKENVLKNRGTRNNLVGLSLTLLGLRKDHSAAVLEMGANHLGEIERLTEILKPTIGLINNIGPSHLEFLKDESGVLKVKSEMVHGLRKKDLLFLNGDDPMLERVEPRCKKIRFGLKKHNDFRATDIKSNGRISFKVNSISPLAINLPGMHNLYNALAAVAVTSYIGIDIFAVRDRLLDFRLPDMRMELKKVKGIEFINDAYNSNPLSLKCAIQTLSDFKRDGKKILVSGDMLELGPKGRFFHSLIGRAVAESSVDTLITVGRLSRYTAEAAGSAGMKKENLWPCSDAEEATTILRRIAKPGDTVLIKGSRAMAMEEIINHL